VNPGVPIATARLLPLLPLLLIAGCNGDGGKQTDAGSDTGSDTDLGTDTDTGSDTATDTHTDTGTDTGTGTDSDLCEGPLVRFVDREAEPAGDGLAWETAFTRVQDGLDAALEVTEACGSGQVWVVQGTYFVYEESVHDTIALRPGVEVYGGFTGDEASLEERDPDPTLTVLDGHDSASGPSRVRHVVTGASDALVDGFTITGGRVVTGSDDDPHQEGAGVLMLDVQGMVLRNSVVTGNEGRDNGGASVQDSGAAFVGCEFRDNLTIEGAGALQIWYGEVDIEGCTFTGHEAATGLGGALRSYESVLSIKRSVIGDNLAQYGGGAHFDNTWVWITDSVFTGNTADEGGGLEAEGSQVQITGATFHGNGGFDASAILAEYAELSIVSSIFWGNPLSTPGDVVENVSSDVAIDYSVFAGGAAGEGVVNADPLFVDQDNGDYHLQAGSPAIDAADGDALGDLDFDLNPRVDDPATTNTGIGDPPYGDIGAFEHQP